MFKRNTFYLLGLIPLVLFLSCKKEVTKEKATISNFAFEAIPRGVKVGESILYQVKGGVRPLKFSTTFGMISSSGWYTAQETGIGQINVIDSENNKISAVIYVYSPLSIIPSSLILIKNKSHTFSGKGGVPPYRFKSNIGTIDPNTGTYFGSSKIGEEIITVYDSIGNRTTSTVTINPDLTITPTSLSMSPRGSATLSAIGGIPPYSFSASLGTINSSGIYRSPSNIGNDVVTVSDSLGFSATSNIGVYTGLGIDPSRINLKINSSTTFTATGGASPYSFSASVGSIDSSTGVYTAPSTNGTAIIAVSDNLGKKQTAEVIIYSPLQLSPTNITLAVGNSTDKFSAKEGMPPYKFSTDIGSINTASGIFTAPNFASTGKVTVTDQLNNKVVANVTIKSKLEVNPPTFSLGVNRSSNFFGYFGVPPYTYKALIGDISEDGSYTAPSEPGNETITVKDSLGNHATSVGTIEILASKLSFKDSSKTMRPGETYSFKATDVTGGTPPYTFAANFGAMDSLGLYHFPEGKKEDWVQVKDSKNETATLNIIGDFKNLWTWISGTNSLNHFGEYGSDAENMPGGKIGSVGWIDADGNFWLFGGAMGPELFFHDLWIYKIDSNLWFLVNGADLENPVNNPGNYGELKVKSSSNFPGGRYYPSNWTDKQGNFWLFGGGGYRGQFSEDIGLNDLWKYDPKIQQWTWMSGSKQPNQPGDYGTKGVPSSTNLPGARHSSMSWTDSSGNLWLFGGYGKAPKGWLNDLWKFNTSTNEWTWVSGSSSINPQGNYGTKGTPSINNSPSRRQNAISWTDSSGNLWLFGGWGYGVGSSGYLNDLWKYEPKTNEWTWVSGSDSPNQAGIYENPIPIINTPGGRQTSISWTDTSGNLWLFGGLEIFTSSSKTYYNDLWKFNITDKTWTWVSGGKIPNQPGIYGEMGKTSQNKVPGARESGISWYDSAGNLWLFGGYGYNQSEKGFLNDLWKFIPK